MKFTPEVIAALKTLKSAAENDFERHRLDVLEKDLTAPPKVEIIDEKHQKFLGVTYHEEKSGTYRQVVGIIALKKLALLSAALNLWLKPREKTIARKELALYVGKSLPFRAVMILKLVRRSAVTL